MAGAHDPWMPQDTIALFILVAVFSLKAFGLDGNLDSVLTLIVGYYFGKRASSLPPPRGL